MRALAWAGGAEAAAQRTSNLACFDLLVSDLAVVFVPGRAHVRNFPTAFQAAYQAAYHPIIQADPVACWSNN